MLLQRMMIALVIFIGSSALLRGQGRGTGLSKELQAAEELLYIDPQQSLKKIVEIQRERRLEGHAADELQARVIAARAAALLGKSEDILKWALPALNSAKNLQDSQIWMRLLCSLAAGYEFSGQKAKALAFLNQALVQADQGSDPWIQAYVRNDLAWLYNRDTQLTEAVRLLKEAFQRMQALPKDELYGDLLNNLGTLYATHMSSQKAEAEKLLLESVEFFEARKKTFYIATVLYNLGLLYQHSDVQKSLPILERSLRSSQTIGDAGGEAYAHYAMGRSHLTLNYNELAEADYRRAMLGFRETSNSMMIAETWRYYLLSLIGAYKYDLALRLLPKAEESIRKDGSREDLIRMLEVKTTLERHFKLSESELKTWEELYDTYRLQQESQDKDITSRYMAELDLERKDHENKLQALELQRNRRESTFKSWVIFGSVVLMLVLSFGLILLVQQMKKIRSLQQYVETKVLQRFLPPEIVMEIREGRSRLDEEAQVKRITVGFIDLVDFTRSTELLGPARSARVLNDFLLHMTEIIFSQGGTIDKFIGDAIMLLFGAPTEMDATTQAQRAVRCAQQMQLKLIELNKIWLAEVGLHFAIRTGLSQGEAMVGTFGSEQRSDYTAIGTTVNLAARIETQAAPNQILISKELALQLEPNQYRSLGSFKLKGLQDDQELFEVLPACVRQEDFKRAS